MGLTVSIAIALVIKHLKLTGITSIKFYTAPLHLKNFTYILITLIQFVPLHDCEVTYTKENLRTHLLHDIRKYNSFSGVNS